MRKLIVTAVFLFSLCGVWAETGIPTATSPTKVVTDLCSAHKGKADPLQYPASKNLLGAYFEKGWRITKIKYSDGRTLKEILK